MYLLTFVVVLVSILGLYANVVALQAAKTAEQQKVIGQQMITWHESAVTFVRNNTLDNPGVNGCNLTFGLTTPADCTVGGAATIVSLADVPSDYNPAHNFSSVYYTSAAGTQRYVITFVPPPAGGAGAIVERPPVGFRTGEIFQQLRNTDLSRVTYGMVTGQQIRPAPDIAYTMPASGAVPDGSIAIVTIQ